MSKTSRWSAFIALVAIGGFPAHGAPRELSCSGNRIVSDSTGHITTQRMTRTIDIDLARRTWREGNERSWNRIVAYGGGRATLIEYHHRLEYRLAFIDDGASLESVWIKPQALGTVSFKGRCKARSNRQ